MSLPSGYRAASSSLVGGVGGAATGGAAREPFQPAEDAVMFTKLTLTGTCEQAIV